MSNTQSLKIFVSGMLAGGLMVAAVATLVQGNDLTASVASQGQQVQAVPQQAAQEGQAAAQKAPQMARKTEFKLAPGISWAKFDKAMTQGSKANMPTYVKFNAKWCGYCKKMQNETFAQKSVQQMLNQNFAIGLVDIDDTKSQVVYKGKSYTEKELAQQFGVTGTPTSLFLDEKGEVIGAIPGYLPADEFENILKYISSKSYKDMKFDEWKSKQTT